MARACRYYDFIFDVCDTQFVLTAMLSKRALKVLQAILVTPLTNRIAAANMHSGHENDYDRNTGFTPFFVKHRLTQSIRILLRS